MNDLLHAFPGQDEDEAVFVFARPYPVAFLGTALAFLAVFAFSLLGQFVAGGSYLVDMSPANINITILGFGIFQLLALIVFLVAIFDFYYDIMVITDRRLVDIQQEQLFYRKIAELDLEDVEDVSSIVHGILPSIFDYGTVQIQTAGEQENFIMEYIHHPREVAAITASLAAQAKKQLEAAGRFPQSPVMAVINNQSISTASGLQAAGAISTSQLSRFPNNGAS